MIGYDFVKACILGRRYMAVIGDVEEIIAKPVEEFEQVELCQREIMVHTKQGETFRLVLQAENKKSLEFRKKPKTNWLKPKVYQGKSMHEEELENVS